MDGYTESIVIVLGSPVRGNPSQFAIERGLESIGLDWRVLSLEVDLADLATAVAGFRVSGIRAIWFDDAMAKHAAQVFGEESASETSPAIDGFIRRETSWERFEVRSAVRQRETDEAARAKEAAMTKEKEPTNTVQDPSTSVDAFPSKDSISQSHPECTDIEPPGISDSIRRQTRQLQLCIEVWTGKRVPVSVLAEAIEEYESV
jgi:hypothetical protein